MEDLKYMARRLNVKMRNGDLSRPLMEPEELKVITTAANAKDSALKSMS